MLLLKAAKAVENLGNICIAFCGAAFAVSASLHTTSRLTQVSNELLHCITAVASSSANGFSRKPIKLLLLRWSASLHLPYQEN